MTVIIGQGCGLPNITGEIMADYGGNFSSSSGAFTLFDRDRRCDSFSGELWKNIKFDASKSNPIYGKSDRVTTDNITVRYWKRVA